MFIHQAISAFKIWHEKTPEIDENVIKLLDR
jgi:shikimate 5-dehydrogenase